MKSMRRALILIGWLGRRGTAAIEFSIIAPVFFLMLMAVFELGRLFWMNVSLQQAVEQTARYAMAEYTRESFGTDAEFATWFAAWQASLVTRAGTELIAIDPSLIDFSSTAITAATATTPDIVSVRGEYVFGFLYAVIPGMPTITLSAVSTAPLIGAKSTYIPP